MSNLHKQRQFLERFYNNGNAHGLQQANGSYIAVRECITDKILQDHFNGTQTLGVYTTNPENNTSKFLCIDIDDDHQTEEFNRLIHYLNVNNLVYLRESVRTGRFGHVWLFFDRPVDTALVHRMGVYACVLSGLKAESFPKQARVKLTGLGNLVRLPLGVHRKQSADKVRGLFLDCPDEDQIDWFLQQPLNDSDSFIKLCSTLPAPAKKSSEKRKTTIQTPLLAEFPPDWGFKEQPSGEIICQCPTCAEAGFDRSRNNLAINPTKNVLFCHRGHSFINIIKSLRNLKVRI